MPHPEWTNNGLLYIEEKKSGGGITILQGHICYKCGDCCKKEVKKGASTTNINIPNYTTPMIFSLLLGVCPPISLILLIVCLVLLIKKRGRNERICYAIGIIINLAWLGFYIISSQKK
jgi:ABC-type nickel/cobalt efflux system permease component RcnA